MLFSIFILTILLISLIGARNLIATSLQGITILLTGSKRVGLILYSLIFLPGVIIHEISHFFMAGFLGVPTGDITIFPSGKTETGSERLGSVQVGKSDIFRGSLIGIAPLLFGSVIIIALTRWQFPELITSLINLNQPLNHFLLEGRQILAEPLNLIWVYLILAITNTMFVSDSDRRSWPAMLIVLIILSLVGIWSGLATPVAQAIKPSLLTGINILTAAFFVSLIIDVVVFAVLLVAIALLQKLCRSRFHFKPNL